MDFISYGRQCIEEDDIAAVVEVLKSDFLTCGPKVAEFERDLAEVVGAKYTVAVSNGTAALHIAALTLGLGAGDEVITSPLTFAATANCVLYAGATPVFADICPDTMLLDIKKVRDKITPKTKAIIPVHYGGELCNMDVFTELAAEYNLAIIQDCAHSLGGKTCGKHQGEYPGMQIWSFHPVKTITTGEGGAVTTNDEALYKKLVCLRTHGITRDASQFIGESQGGWYYEMQDLGYNYRLTDIQCALGITQLKKLPRFLKRRQEIVERYNEAFKNAPLEVQQTPEWSTPARHLYTIRLHDKYRRREAFNALQAKNIGVNVHYIPVYLLPHYKNLCYEPGLCPIAEDSYERMLTLPLHPSLTDEQVEYIIKCVKESVQDKKFESQRLLYREIRAVDAENIVRWRSNPEACIYFRNPKPVSLKEHLEWYETIYLKNSDRTDFIIVEKESTVSIGIVGISISNETGEVSYIIGENDFSRRGFATEAINALVKIFSDKITDFSAEIHRKNIASIKTIEKCGFAYSHALESGFLLYKRNGEGQ